MDKDNITETVENSYDPDKDPEAKSDTGQLPSVERKRRINFQSPLFWILVLSAFVFFGIISHYAIWLNWWEDVQLNFCKIERGMSKDEVLEILGKPTYIYRDLKHSNSNEVELYLYENDHLLLDLYYTVVTMIDWIKRKTNITYGVYFDKNGITVSTTESIGR